MRARTLRASTSSSANTVAMPEATFAARPASGGGALDIETVNSTLAGASAMTADIQRPISPIRDSG